LLPGVTSQGINKLTLWTYGFGTIIGLFKKEAMSREGWKQ